jgi:hypothetical protein
LLFASYLNKILGVVCVFIIIIMFSSNRLVNFEGFDSNMSASSNEKIQKLTSIHQNEQNNQQV